MRFLVSRLDDVSSRPNAQLSKAPAVRTTFHTIRTLFRLKHHLSGRRGFPFGPSSTLRSFKLLSLHPSRCFNSPSGRLSVFDQASNFLSKIKYRKIATTVWTTWIPVRTLYSLRQVCNSNSIIRTPVYHVPDVRSTNMKIACSRSTVRTAILLVRTPVAFIRKLLAADVRPSGRQCLTVRMRLSNRKDFQQNF
jgi:hypothetical protein